MNELLQQLGIDWRLLLSQAANFLILLILLTFLVYRPILNILKERRMKIEEGLEKADEADRRLEEAGIHFKNRLKEAESGALKIIKEAEKKGKDVEAALLAEAKEKENALLKNANLIIEAKNEEARKLLQKEAVSIIKKAIRKTVELSPKEIDEALIKKAVESINE